MRVIRPVACLAALSLLAPLPFFTAAASAPPFDSSARIAYLIDLSSGAVLLDKGSAVRMPPASMAKMMTVYVAFDQLARGEISLDTKFTVSPETWTKWNNQGSTMFLKPGEQVSVADLLHGIVTLSGNDACVVLAEGISGSEEAFADLMNRTAKRIGVTGSRFGNSNGWPDEGVTFVTARDLGTIARRTIEDFPKLYDQFYAQDSFTWNGISQPNRDPLLGKIRGADGLKTGHTEEAGYGFTGSAEQEGRRLIMVVAGLDSFNGRIEESVRLMNWGFKAWRSRPLFPAGATVVTAPVQLGSARDVPLVAPRQLGVTLPAAEAGDYKVAVRYVGPIKAPIAKGQQVAELVVKTGSGEQVMPLVAGAAVGEAGLFGRIWNGFMSLFG